MAGRKGKDEPENENQDTEDRIQAKALKDGEEATDKLIQDLKDGK